MRHSNVSKFSAVLCLVLIGAARIANATTFYTVTALPSLEGEGFSQANDINNAGQVVGDSFGQSVGPSEHVATIWNGTTPTALAPAFSPLAIDAQSFAYGINNSGQVVGAGTNNSPFYQVMWNGNAATILGQGEAFGINNSGQVAGVTANSQAVV